MKFWTSLLVILHPEDDVSNLLVLFYSSNIVTRKREEGWALSSIWFIGE